MNPDVKMYPTQRGQILHCLYRYDVPGGDNFLAEIFPSIPLPKLRQHLRYLSDKGFVTIQDVIEEFSSATMMITLTVKAVDLLEGRLASSESLGIKVPEL